MLIVSCSVLITETINTVPSGFYTVIGSALMINEEYFSVLPSTGEYDLRVAGDKFSFEVTVRVSPSVAFITSFPSINTLTALPSTMAVSDILCISVGVKLARAISGVLSDHSLTTLLSGDCIIGEQPGGDGFILAREECADFIYSATFDLGTGAAVKPELVAASSTHSPPLTIS